MISKSERRRRIPCRAPESASSRGRASSWLGVVCASALLTVTGCSDGVTPALRDLVYKGQAPDSTVVLLLEVGFDDPDGDLGDGFLEVFIDGQSTSLGLLDLAPIFVRNAISTDATSGTLAIPLELALDEETLPPSGTTFSVGFRATDAANHTSPEATTFLKLTY